MPRTMKHPDFAKIAIWLIFFIAHAFFLAGCSSATKESKENESDETVAAGDTSGQRLQKLIWSWDETDGTRTTMSIDAIASGMMEVEYLKLNWDRVSRPSMKVERSTDHFLEIRYSTERDSLIAILNRPVEGLQKHANVTRQKAKPIGDVREGLRLLQMFAKNDGRFEEDLNWSDN